MKKHIIFVSGVGDHSRWFYDLAARRWTKSGVQAHAYIFGWDNHQLDFESKFASLLGFIDSLASDNIQIVGISAGGTAALNAFIARPKSVKKLVMISSPFQHIHYTLTAMLESMDQANAGFATLDDASKRRMLSITGLKDEVVPTRISLFDGVKRRHVFGFTHVMNIFVALIIQKRPLRKFLNAQ